MPWLHMIFDAYEDYKRTREREVAELAERDAIERAAAEAIALDVDAIDFAEGDDDGDRKKKKKHRKKDKK
ncbi:MAG: hypothetical protein V7632_2390 [Bradyrhizobium sp.]